MLHVAGVVVIIAILMDADGDNHNKYLSYLNASLLRVLESPKHKDTGMQ